MVFRHVIAFERLFVRFSLHVHVIVMLFRTATDVVGPATVHRAGLGHRK